MTENERQKIENEKVRVALEQIEQAQGLILEATQELCSVRGMAEEWSALGDLYDQVKSHWHRVNQRFGQLQASRGRTA